MVGARRPAPRRLKFACRHVGSEPQLIYNPTVHGKQRVRLGRRGRRFAEIEALQQALGVGRGTIGRRAGLDHKGMPVTRGSRRPIAVGIRPRQGIEELAKICALHGS
jgi:hypothetical protein